MAFQKFLWEYGSYSKEQYLERREKEDEIIIIEKRNIILLIPEEVVIPKIHFETLCRSEKEYNDGAVESEKVL
jgi:hypothetical protein